MCLQALGHITFTDLKHQRAAQKSLQSIGCISRQSLVTKHALEC